LIDEQTILLIEKEVAFRRMDVFHRDRVQEFANGDTLLEDHNGGILVVHMVPESCVLTRKRLASTELKANGSRVYALGCRDGYTRFNIDGLLNFGSRACIRAYTQVYRDGRLEAAMSNVAYPLEPDQKNSLQVLRDGNIEAAMLSLVPNYLAFCKSIGVKVPIYLFSALVGCKGIRICTNWSFREASDYGVDRSPCHFPEIEITSLDVEPPPLLRPWCDTLWQTCGMERSLNFDEDGNWRERHR
jgi:hypothetical protein